MTGRDKATSLASEAKKTDLVLWAARDNQGNFFLSKIKPFRLMYPESWGVGAIPSYKGSIQIEGRARRRRRVLGLKPGEGPVRVRIVREVPK